MDHKTATTPHSQLADAPELVTLGVAGAAEAIRAGEITSEVYAAALLQQAAKLRDLRSFISIDEPALLKAARDADAARRSGSKLPLLGVPLGVKDSFLTKGLATSIGLAGLAHFIPSKDAEVVAAVKDAGALVFGKNNLVEMSFGLTGHNAHFGQVKNPHDQNRVTGGSSSGSAASVAAGIVPASLGGDTVGSIRVPAALCGLVGFKPTTGRWPRNGVAPISHTLDTPGVIARSVEDCALVDQAVTGDETAQALSSGAGLKGVRLAYAPGQFLDLVDPEVDERFRDVLETLKNAGAEVIEVDLGDDFAGLTQQTTWGIFFHETMGSISQFLARYDFPMTFEEILHSLKPELREAWGYMVLPEGGGAISDAAYQAAQSSSRPEIQRRFDRAFVERGADAILFPTTPCTAPLIDLQTSFTIAGREVTPLALANHTVAASSVGLPGISIPVGLSRDRLPIGLELDGRRDSDRTLLALARKIEGVLGYATIEG